MIDFSKLNLTESLEAEASSSEKALASADKKKDTAHTLRQKNQMAQKAGTTQKSDVVYASEEYFSELRTSVQLHKAQEEARVSWRETLEEAKVKDGSSDEGTHPYVSIMPHKDSKEKEVKKKMKKNDEMEKAVSEKLPESVSFCEAFDTLVEKEISLRDAQKGGMMAKTPSKPVDHRAIRGKMLAKAPKTKDTRSDAEKMTDATGPRPGSRYRGD